jgi:phage terminase Nu1 subunit (DNA packaging protein)
MTVVSATTLAHWLGVTDKTVRKLAKREIVIRDGRGLYALELSVARYCEELRKVGAARGDNDSLAKMRAQRIRVAKEQADQLVIKNAVARGELLDADEVERTWGGVLRGVRAGLLAVPSRIGARFPHLTPVDIDAIDREVRDALAEIVSDGE